MGYAPENTMASFARALELGVDAVELDVHLTADGEAVVIHDPVLEHTSDGHGLVGEHTLDEVRRLDVGSYFGPEFVGQRIPTLGEVLSWARGRCVVDIEIKAAPIRYQGIEQRVVDLVAEHQMANEVIVISFDHPTSRRVKQIAPYLATGILYRSRPVDPVRLATDAQADALLPHWEFCTADHVQSAHAAGLSIHPWATSEPEQIRRLIAMGVDSICSNHPDRVIAELERR